MDKRLEFSRFAHSFSKDGIRAYFNSLRLKPVFVPNEIDEFLLPYIDALNKQKSLNQIEIDVPIAEIKNTVDQLIKNKIVISDPLFDEAVITHFKGTLGKPYIKTAFLLLTNRCNFNCSYCFVEKDIIANKQTLINMSIETALKTLDFFTEMIRRDQDQFEEEKSIILYGGEPLLNKETAIFIIEEVQRRKEKGTLPAKLNINLITNGSLVTPALVALFKKHGVKMSLSVDGNEESTNACRCFTNGKPVYQEISRAAALCRDADLPFGLSVTLSEESLDNEEATMNVVNELGAVSLGLNPLLNADLPIELKPDYGVRTADFLIRAYKKFRAEGISEDRMMRKALAFAHSSIYPFDCEAAGGNQIVVSPEGEVGLCHGFIGDKKYFVTTVDNLEFKPEEDPVYLEWAKRSPISIDGCQDCPALGICGGGCALVGYRNEGSIWNVDSNFCLHAQKTLEWMVWDLYDTMTEEIGKIFDG